MGDEVSPPKSHALVAQWSLLPALIRRLEKEMGQEVLTLDQKLEIDRLVHEFEEVDRTSFAFRYPETKDGKVATPQGIVHLNVRRFGDAMDRLAHLLGELVITTDYYSENFGPGAGP